MVEISKTLTKIVRIIVKYIPFVIGSMYFIQSILFCFGIVIPRLTITYRFSILSLICMLAMSVLLKFCIWHRLPLYYGASIDIINTIDYYITIPISNKSMLVWYLVITGVFILIGVYLKNRNNVKNRNT